MEKRKKQRKRIISLLIAIVLVLIITIIFLFKEEISTAIQQWRVDRNGWTEESLGEISTEEFTETTEEETVEEYVDSLGINYTDYTFYVNNYALKLPTEWKVTTTRNTIYAIQNDQNNPYAQLEIAIIPLKTYQTQPEEINKNTLLQLRNETLFIFQSVFKYHGYDDTYSLLNYDSGSALFDEETKTLYQDFTFNLESDTLEKNYYKPSCAVYYSVINKVGYAICITGPSNYELEISELAKTITKNINTSPDLKYYTEDDYQYLSLDTDVVVDNTTVADVSFNVNSNWISLFTSNVASYDGKNAGLHSFKLTNDISSPEYGISISVGVQKTEGKLPSDFDTFVTNTVALGIYPELNDFKLSIPTEEGYCSYKIFSTEDYYYGDTKGYLSNYIKYITFESSKNQFNYAQISTAPLSHYFYSLDISKDRKLLIDISYNNANQEIALGYLKKIISSISY